MRSNKIYFIPIIFIFFSCQEKKVDTSDYGQYAPPDAFSEDEQYAYYGSENPWDRRFFSEEQADKFVKRRGQAQMLALIEDKPEEALEMCLSRLSKDENDLEALFNLTIAYSQLNRMDDAYKTMIKAINRELPFERFLAGPRDLLGNLYNYPGFIGYKKNKNVKLIHGPMLGSVTTNSAKIWLRTAEEYPIEIKLYESEETSNSINSFRGNSEAETDYTAVISLTNLRKSTKYFYDIFIDDIKVNYHKYSFSTYSDLSDSIALRIGFGGCAGFTPVHERIWDSIVTRHLDAFLFLGDNVYISLPDRPGAFQNYTYYRRQSRPEYRRFISSTPIYAIWDDHDAGIDDVWLGPYPDKPDWKPGNFKIFKDNWVNPGYGTQEYPACWFKLSVGSVDIFMLDGRMYRTNPFKAEKTMLGPVQKGWLLKELKESKAVFKILASPVPWSFDAKPGARDTWNGFREEREEIFSFIEENKINGVILLSSDRHRSDVRRIERKNGYDLYEFESARLTNIHTHDLEPGALFGYNEKCLFGLLEIIPRRTELTFKIITIDGEEVYSLTLKKEEFTFNKKVLKR